MQLSTSKLKLPRVSLEQWGVFQAVVESGSFANAAELLYKSQSAISYNINKLQETIGLQLFCLVGRKLELTEAGLVILNRSKKIVAQANQLESAITHFQQGIEHELVISIDELFPIELLSIALKNFEKTFPETHVMVLNHRKSVDEHYIKHIKAHCIISRNPVRNDSSRLIELSFWPYAHPDYLYTEAHQHYSEPCLHHHRQITHEGLTTPQLTDDYHHCCQWQVDSLNMMMELIANKQGYGWLPTLHAEKSNLPLTKLKIDDQVSMNQPLYLTAADPTLVGKAQQSFMGILQSLC